MIAALRPGGRLLLEEADPGLQPLLCPDDHGPAQHLVDAGIATAAEIDQHLGNIATGQLPDLATSPLISAWGRTV